MAHLSKKGTRKKLRSTKEITAKGKPFRGRVMTI